SIGQNHGHLGQSGSKASVVPRVASLGLFGTFMIGRCGGGCYWFLCTRRPREAPSPAKIQIFALKGGNFRGLKGGKWIRVVTCPSNIRFSCLFSENFSSQAPFHYIHACILILDNLTFIFIFLRAFLAAFRVKESQIEALAGANTISPRLSPRSSSD